MKRRVLDVSRLPTLGFGPRDPLWWGVMLLIAIEATMLALFVVSYFYTRDRTDPFPPAHVPREVALVALLDVLLWCASAWPQRLTSHAATAGHLRPMRRRLVAATALAVLALLVRLWVFDLLPFRWDDHAYGSMVWGLLGLHFLHGLTAIGEDLVYCILLFRGPVEDKHRVDIEVSAPLVYFVVVGAWVVWLVVFLEVLVGGGR